MKILFLCRSLSFGGAERQLIALAKGLQKKGHKVAILTFYNPPLNESFDADGVEVIGLNKRKRWDLYGFFKNLRKTVKDYEPDILNSYLTVPNVLACMLKGFIPNVKIVLGVRSSNMEWRRYDWLACVTSYLEKKLSRKSDLIITNSKAGYQHALLNGMKENLLRVIPNGIDTNKFQFDPIQRIFFREQLGVDDNTILIAQVARLDPMKDYPTFLKAAYLLLKNGYLVKFICIGNGPKDYKNSLKATAESLNISEHVYWLNARNPVPYSAFDIVCLSSSFGEGFPNVLGEAMSSGVPCVATNVGDSAHVIGNTGLIVDPDNPDAFYRAEAELIKKVKVERTLISGECRSHIQKNFSLDQMIDKTEKELGFFERR
jgi:glycosyltransferase involved in cell wall biosynthesis